MGHFRKTACMLTLAVCFADGAFAQGTSTGGAPPATHSSSSDSGGGQSASIKGGAGTAGEYGTDPATLKKEETARQQKSKDKASASK
ncbi:MULTISPECIES: hypothetical protein [Burkholderiaceae]|nr:MULTISPECIES: hypothetical protein [Burkholderiaceae]MDP9157610.1 hypothetical protein [Pseudomonadota bacterium]